MHTHTSLCVLNSLSWTLFIRPRSSVRRLLTAPSSGLMWVRVGGDTHRALGGWEVAHASLLQCRCKRAAAVLLSAFGGQCGTQ